MENEFLAIIPHIPHILAAGKSVWELMIKPLLVQKNYPISNELEQEMIIKENNKDIIGIIEKLENFAKTINNSNVIQINYGKNSQQFNLVNSPNLAINIGNTNNNTENEELSKRASNILIAMSKDNFRELRVYENITGFYSLNSNAQELGSGDIDEIIEIKECITLLINLGFIIFKRKNTYELTQKGITKIKQLTFS